MKQMLCHIIVKGPSDETIAAPHYSLLGPSDETIAVPHYS